MPFSLIPRGVYDRVTDISPKALADKGIKLVLADLDNTLVPYHVIEPGEEVRRWKEELNANGITLFLLSNSRLIMQGSRGYHALFTWLIIP